MEKPAAELKPFSGTLDEPILKPFTGTLDGEEPKRGFAGWARDVAATAVKGAIAVPEAAVGLADIATGGQAGKALQEAGFDPKRAKEIANDWHSDATKEAQQKFQAADGIWEKAKTAIQNPSLIATAVGESLPSMGAGGVAARGILGATRLGQMGLKGATIAGAAGEGVTMAGSQAEAIRQESADGLLSPGQTAAAVGTGLAGGLIGGLAGRVANRLGVGDAETMLAQGAKGMAKQATDEAANPLLRKAAHSIPGDVVKGAISEGFLEELPQSVAEQVMQNLALDKPWADGLDDAIVMGVLSGGAMGGAAAGYKGLKGGNKPGEAPEPAPAPAGPAPLLLENNPDPLIAYTDGSVGRRSEMEAHLASLPEDVRMAERARLLGYGDQAKKDEAQPVLAGDRMREAFTAQMEALRQQEEGEQQVAQSDAPDGAAALSQQQAVIDSQRAADMAADPDDEIYQSVGAIKPSQAMGLNPASGTISTAAAIAVDSGATQNVMQQAAAQAQAAQVAEQAKQQPKKAAAPAPAPAVKQTAQQAADPETGEISPFSDWSDDQLSATFRSAQVPEAREQMAKELARRRDVRDQSSLQDELQADLAEPDTSAFDSMPDGTFAQGNPSEIDDNAISQANAELAAASTTAKENANADQAPQAQQGSAQPAQARPEAAAQVGDAQPAQPAAGAQAQAQAPAGGQDVAPQPQGQATAVAKSKSATKEELDHLFGLDKFGLDKKRPAALARIESGKAWYLSKDKALAFVSKNGLADTHEVVADNKRYVVQAKAQPVQVAPNQTPVKQQDQAAPTAAAESVVAAAPTKQMQEAASQSSAPVQSMVNPAKPAPKVSRKAAEAEAQAETQRADYFQPGNIVESYGGGHDRVVSYQPSADGKAWSAKVQSVVKRDGQWVPDPQDNRTRTRSAQPEEKALKTGPVERAAKAEPKSQKPAAPSALPAYGASNKLVSTSRAEELRKELKAMLLGRLNSGIDPAMLAVGTELAVFHIEAGVRKFSDFVKTMASDLDTTQERLRPYLRAWYNGARDMVEDNGQSVSDMDNSEAVRAELAKMDESKAEPVKADATEGNAEPLSAALLGAIQAGKMPKDNPALKKFAEAFDGKPADAARMKEVQEQLEAAIVMASRAVVAGNEGDASTFAALLRMYESQPNLNVRTSTSIANQAYSTPAPLAYLASRLAGIEQGTRVLEPTAGIGMLVMAADPANAVVNELNDLRVSLLKEQGFAPTQKDAATESLSDKRGPVDAVITNPPFGSIKDANDKPIKVKVNDYNLGQIDHLIAARALETMKDDGRATLIIGANKAPGGLSTDDRIFFNWLYSHYNVTGHFEVNGDLYQRQGAGWPVRVIAISGREQSKRISPVAGTIERADNWDQVYDQYQNILDAGRRSDRGAGSTAVRAGNDQARPANLPDVAGQQAAKPDRQQPRASESGAGNVARAPARDLADRAVPIAEPLGHEPGELRLNGQSFVPVGLEQVRPSSPAATERPAKPTGAPALAEPSGNEFQTAYVPHSERKDEGVLIPTNMAQPTKDALNQLEDRVGDVDEFARKELGYESKDALHNALMGLQVDSVAMAIHQIKSGKAVVIADQTGIGKGRQAASIIRWAVKHGMTPVFVSVNPSLFTDMHGDLADIGTHDVTPFILNSDAWVAGEGGAKLFGNKANTHRAAIESIANTGALPDGRNALFMTYSQINTANVQRRALMALAPNAVFILDESHNAAGASGTGDFMIGALGAAKGVTYLSATYAKRPDNMPLYFKTDVGDAAADSEGLAAAMAAGGLPLQTVVSNNLVKAGQMFRRERSYDGVTIASTFDTKNRELHEQMSDAATQALRAIVDADKMFHSVFVRQMDKELRKEGSQIQDNAGNQVSAGVQHTEFSSVVHNFVRQMLLGLKAQTAANEAIASLKRGEKPIIAVENTMGSFLSEYAEQNNLSQGDALGDFDYRTVLLRALERSRVINVVAPTGEKSKKTISLNELDPKTRKAYDDAKAVIDGLSIDIPVSPIDWMRAEIKRAGFSVAEITGRNLAVDYSDKTKPLLSAVDAGEQKDKVASTRRFNAGDLDALILNVAGATGISLHASEKFRDQRQRHMVVAQAAQDINIFMQMLGRVHRTGQVGLPKYTILSVDLPTEKRPTAVLSGKMKSLNANTSSNTESATSVKTADILNKYGDQIVNQYLLDNLELAQQLGVDDLTSDSSATEDLARKTTGRLALQPIEVQHAFYDDVEAQYNALIEYLNKTNQNDLEPRTFDFDAKETRQEVLFDGPDKSTPFGQDAVYGEYSIKAQGAAMKPEEIHAAIAENLQGKTGAEHAKALTDGLLQAYADQTNERLAAADPDKYAATLKVLFGEQRANAMASEAKRAMTAQDLESALGVLTGVEFLRSHAIGSTFRVDINSEPYNAVITNIRSTHKTTGNPFSLSKLQVTVSVNGALRSLTVPATQFRKIEVSSIAPVFRVEQLFKEQPANQRETAKIITGNLLAAYGELKGVRGTIITFTKSDGTSEQGILLPKLFDYSKNTQGDYRLRSGKDALHFLQNSQSPDVGRFGIASRDNVVRVVPLGQGIQVRVPKSKLQGAKYFLDKGLIEAGGDFVSTASSMVANVDDPASATKMLDLLMNKQALYALPSMAEEAKAMAPDQGDAHFASNREREGSKLDRAVLDMVADGSDAADVLKLIAAQSKSRFNRQIAALLVKTGANPALSMRTTLGGKADNLGVYRRSNNSLNLTPAAESRAEQIFLHEMIHAATLAALDRKGLVSQRMKALFAHVQKSGLAGHYGMKNVGEFVAEAFSNPEFQRALKDVKAPKESRIATAWDGFLSILRSILGLTHNQENALAAVLELGVPLMREDMGVRQRFTARTGANAYMVDSNMAPVNLRLEGWSGSASELSALARDVYSRELQGTTVHNGSLAADVAFSSEGKGEAFGARGKLRSPVRAEMVKVLRELVGNAVKVAESAPAKGRAADSKAFHTLVAPLLVNGQMHAVRVTVREALQVPQGQASHKFYDVTSVQMERSPGVHGFDDAASNASRPAPSEASGISVSELARSLKVDGFEDDGDAFFDASDLAGVKKTALERITQATSHPGKVSLWDKTVGTMRHLSERNPAFKPVFDSAQQFIDDVAMLANDVANVAPRILPRVETLGDIFGKNRKQAISPEDNKAVAKPLFEGTLLWARDESGRAVLASELAANMSSKTLDEKAHILLRQKIVTAQTLKMWQGMPQEQYEKTINNKFASSILKPGVVFSPRELKDLFGANAQQVSLYEEARGAIDRSLDMTTRADMLRALGKDFAGMREVVLEQASLEDAMTFITQALQDESRSNPDMADRMMALNNQIVTRYEQTRDLMKAGYAPLSRFGRYTLDVVGPDGAREYFGMFESIGEANRMAMLMRSEFKGATITQGTMSQEDFKLFQGITPEALEEFGNMLGLDGDKDKAKREAFQAYLDLAKNNQSAMKRLIHRKGISGYSEDVGRVVASFAYSNARLASSGMNAGALTTAINEIPKEQGELRDVATKLQDYIQNPQEEGQAVRGFLFAQYLGGSVASAMVNMTQPFAVTVPWLSQFGGMKQASAQMARAVKDMAGKTAYEPDLARAMQQAEDDGVVAPQEIHQLMAQARGAGGLQSGDGTRMGNAKASAANKWENLKVAWGQPFALAEQFNRRSTFVAAYRIAKSQGMGNPAEFARKAVLETQFLYSKANKPRWARGAIGGTLFTFKTYSVSYLELMQRTWNAGAPGSAERTAGRRAVAWAMLMLMLMGGAGGLPFVEDAEDVIDGLGQLMGYNVSSKQWRQEAMRGIVGKELAGFLEQGVSGLPGSPIDVSGRMGMGNLLPGTGMLLSKTDHSRDLLELAGPAGDLVKRAFSGAGAMAGGVVGADAGGIGRGAMELMPAAVRNAAKGADMAASGMYKDTKGYKVVSTTLDEALAKAIGFQPKAVSEVQEANGFMMRAKANYTQQSADIKARWAQALFDKDEAGVQRVRERLADWNRKNPDQPIAVKMPDIWKRVREMGKDRTQRIADTAPKAMRQQLRDMAREAA